MVSGLVRVMPLGSRSGQRVASGSVPVLCIVLVQGFLSCCSAQEVQDGAIYDVLFLVAAGGVAHRVLSDARRQWALVAVVERVNALQNSWEGRLEVGLARGRVAGNPPCDGVGGPTVVRCIH